MWFTFFYIRKYLCTVLAYSKINSYVNYISECSSQNCSFSFIHTEDTSVFIVVVTRIMNNMTAPKRMRIAMVIFTTHAHSLAGRSTFNACALLQAQIAHITVRWLVLSILLLYSIIVVLHVLAVSENKYILFHVKSKSIIRYDKKPFRILQLLQVEFTLRKRIVQIQA